MTGVSLLENVFAWAMIAGGLAILVGVRWRPMKLWHSNRPRGLFRYLSRRAKRPSTTLTDASAEVAPPHPRESTFPVR